MSKLSGHAETSAVYCDPGKIRSWTCGTHCSSTGKLNILATGGDNGYNPYCECYGEVAPFC